MSTDTTTDPWRAAVDRLLGPDTPRPHPTLTQIFAPALTPPRRVPWWRRALGH